MTLWGYTGMEPGAGSGPEAGSGAAPSKNEALRESFAPPPRHSCRCCSKRKYLQHQNSNYRFKVPSSGWRAPGKGLDAKVSVWIRKMAPSVGRGGKTIF